jgi:hypothetical protein
MPKHSHHQSKEEEIFSKVHGAVPFKYEKLPNQASEAVKSQNNQIKADEEVGSIKLRAYQIHLEKGGSDLDNWLEAERSLRR